MRISLLIVLVLGCGDSHTTDDGGGIDGSIRDSGGVDSGEVDSGEDAGEADAGEDAGSPTCEHHTDCTLVPVSCCGDCGAYTRDDIASVHDDLVSQQRMDACPDGLACPPCFTEPNPALHATCESGSCGYVDLYDPEMGFTSEFTECTADSDCILRVVDCCPCRRDPNGAAGRDSRRRARRVFRHRLRARNGVRRLRAELRALLHVVWCG